MSSILVTKGGKLTEESNSQLESFFQSIGDESTLVVHFHGGLIPEDKGIAKAERISNHYSEAGAESIFFIWDSGFQETLTRSLEDIWKSSAFQKSLKIVCQMVYGKIKAEDADSRSYGSFLADEKWVLSQLGFQEPFKDMRAISIPQLSVAEIEEVRETIAHEQIAAEFNEDSNISLLDDRFCSDLNTESERSTIGVSILIAKTLATVGSRVIERINSQRDHGIFGTILEEIFRAFYLDKLGKFSWNEMKKDTIESFNEGEQFSGTTFLTKLKMRFGDKPPRIILVGHSAGAIFIQNFLRKANDMLAEEYEFDLVLLAPACTIREFSRVLASCKRRVKGFRIFAMEDKLERKDKIPVYPHSLLYLVSGLFEDSVDEPILGMERFFLHPAFEKYSEIETTKEFLNCDNRVVWSISNKGQGLRSSACSHGTFDIEEDTISSLKYIIAKGF